MKSNNDGENLSEIVVKGAKVHNLKSVDVTFPKNSLTICCGVSGSGKSSLAFDTIFAEGQRRYVESLSSYARQFLGQMYKHELDSITGLSPAVSIDQKSTSHNPRSTVGTVTEIWDHLRLLYARIGISHCPKCESLLKSYASSELTSALFSKFKGLDIQISAPVVRGRKGSHEDLLNNFMSQGFTRVRLNGKTFRIDELDTIDKRKKHDIDIILDRVKIEEGREKRVLESIELAYQLSEGTAIVTVNSNDEVYSRNYSCPKCLIGYSRLEPKDFSFNSPTGACVDCDGLGYSSELDLLKVIENPDLTISQGVLKPWFESSGKEHYLSITETLLEKYGVSPETKFKKMPKDIQEKILYGDPEIKVKASFGGREYMTTFEGVATWVKRRVEDPWGDSNKEKMESYFSKKKCSSCAGGRLNGRARSVYINNQKIIDLAEKTINELNIYFQKIILSSSELIIAERLVKEIRERINFLIEVGLGYLTLARSANSLSGGEAQRIRLASQIGSGLTGVLYVLDEPSIGLHQSDNSALIGTMLRLKNLGNTVLVVEHDEDTIGQADYIIEIGPKAGREGGELVYSGTREKFYQTSTLTSDYLTGKLKIATPTTRKTPSLGYLTIKGATLNNLNNLDVEIPIGLLTLVTGVSGSGKSTLVNDIIANNMSKLINSKNKSLKNVKSIKNYEQFDKLVLVDQSPIGRTPRSNPASYTGLYDKIRDLYAQLPESKARGWKVGRFSFNVPPKNGGGRCEECQGQGTITIEMSFLPDVHLPCSVCSGKRFTRETLEIKYKNKSIADILEMSVAEALEFFSELNVIKRHLETLTEVGLGYVKLGQTATTLSGGEAQRVKLASELLKRSTGKTLYILDEPTTGLHFDDVNKLSAVLEKLVNLGNTMIIIEHNLDVIRKADYVIEMGPSGGPSGGKIVATGTPEYIATLNCATSPYLRKALEKNKINHDHGA